MAKKALLVLAAGMGSRYGGLKQIDGLGPHGETIIDYSVYDAIRAGFDKLVFVIRPHFQADFEKIVSNKYKSLAEVVIIHQESDTPIPGLDHIEPREKPWGTGHAVLVCAAAIHEPFAVINADDYYGQEAFTQMAAFLDSEIQSDRNVLIGYKLANTLSENGHVSRGVCVVNANNELETITERTKIRREADNIIRFQDGDSKFEVPEDSFVSMNFWGFHPSIFDKFRQGFIEFYQSHPSEKQEYFIPLSVDQLIQSGESKFIVLPTNSQWIGVTYKEDKEPTMKNLKRLHENGTYPDKLF